MLASEVSEDQVFIEDSFKNAWTKEEQVSKSNYFGVDITYSPSLLHHSPEVIGKALLSRVIHFYKKLRDAQEEGSALHQKFHSEVEFYKAHRKAIKNQSHESVPTKAAASSSDAVSYLDDLGDAPDQMMRQAIMG